MDSMLYPTFEPVRDRGALMPSVRLPRNYQELVPKFYEQGGKERLEIYVGQVRGLLTGVMAEHKVRLAWDDERGLVSIRAGPSGGLDLSERGWPNFQEHNLGTETGLIAGIIAMKYVSELIKSG